MSTNLNLRVSLLEEGPVTIEFDHSPSEFELSDELYSFDANVRGSIDFNLAGEDVCGIGCLEVEARVPCARCLVPVSVKLDIPVQTVWLHKVGDANLDDDVAAEDSLSTFYQGEEIDVREALHELIMAELPEVAHCRPDCKGLCPGCGVDLNSEACRCAPNSASPQEPAPKETDWKKQLKALGGKD